MASIPRLRPTFKPRPISSICPNQSRGFRTSSHRLAAPMRVPTALMKQMSQQQSMAGRVKKMERRDLPSDFGLMPETFIRSEWRDRPSLLSGQFRRRLRLEFLAMKQKLLDFAATIYYTRWSGKKHPITRKREKWPTRLRERASAARAIHQRLYTAIAAGDSATINTIACTGLQEQVRIRLDQRKAAGLPAEKWTIKYRGITPPANLPWSLQCLIPFKSTKIIADRQASLPVGREAAMRQCIVRIDSTQSLDRGDGKGTKTRKVREYVVLQKLRVEGKEDDWMIWGTVQPSTDEEIEHLIRGKTATTPESLWDRAKGSMPGMV